jgi:hypothetical protein
MCAALRKTNLKPAERFPRNTRKGRGQCGQIGALDAEKSAVHGSYCRGRGDPWFAGNRDFIGFFAMARRLLIPEARS